jgi:aryl-alcohol dehydrogenase-like predicted oxidoreductase
MNFGPQTNEPDSHAIMDRAHEHGINFFDTANNYGWQLGEGITEKIVGRWFAQGGGRREKTVLATKVFCKMGNWPNEEKLSALSIIRQCEASLRRLQTDYIDLYQMHHVDRACPWEEIWQAMETLVAQGKVMYVGSSNFAGWHIVKANEAAKRRNFMGLVAEQCLYNLTERKVEMELLPACRDYGLGVIPWSPLGSGILGGALKKASEGRRSEGGVLEKIEQNRDKLEKYEALCDELGEKPANVALAWLLANPAVTAPIVGPRTTQQIDELLRALDIQLSVETLDALNEIFPGYKTAPEEFAW